LANGTVTTTDFTNTQPNDIRTTSFNYTPSFDILKSTSCSIRPATPITLSRKIPHITTSTRHNVDTFTAETLGESRQHINEFFLIASKQRDDSSTAYDFFLINILWRASVAEPA